MDFSGKVVLVTGASSGIGKATAERFAALGATVAVNSRSSVEEGRAVAERIGGSYHQADIADEGAVLRMIDAVVATHGGLDVLINNAGTTTVIPHADLDAVTDDVWNRILGVNVLGTWYATRGAVPHLRGSENGSIVNITSIAGSNAVGSCIPYSVSKAGLDQMTILLANALGPDVRVNAVAPGLVRTPWTEDWDEVRAAVERAAPMGREAMPEDVAEACTYLADSTFITGEVLTVDGGHMLSRAF